MSTPIERWLSTPVSHPAPPTPLPRLSQSWRIDAELELIAPEVGRSGRVLTEVGGSRHVDFATPDPFGLIGNPTVVAAVSAAIRRSDAAPPAGDDDLAAALGDYRHAGDVAFAPSRHFVYHRVLPMLVRAEDVVIHGLAHDPATPAWAAALKKSGRRVTSLDAANFDELESQMRIARPYSFAWVILDARMLDGNRERLEMLADKYSALVILDDTPSLGLGEHTPAAGGDAFLRLSSLEAIYPASPAWFTGSVTAIARLSTVIEVSSLDDAAARPSTASREAFGEILNFVRGEAGDTARLRVKNHLEQLVYGLRLLGLHFEAIGAACVAVHSGNSASTRHAYRYLLSQGFVTQEQATVGGDGGGRIVMHISAAHDPMDLLKLISAWRNLRDRQPLPGTEHAYRGAA